MNDDVRHALKPCPFCGAPGEIQERLGTNRVFYVAACSAHERGRCLCAVRSRWAETADEAADMWNTRSPSVAEASKRG